MPTYKVTAPDGRIFKLTGDSPPTEGELMRIYKNMGGESTEPSLMEQVGSLNPKTKMGLALLKSVPNIPESAGEFAKSTISGVKSIPGVLSRSFKRTPEENQQALADTAMGMKDIMLKRYGGMDRFLNTIEKDPVGVMGDLSMLFGSLDPTRAVTGPAKALGKKLTTSLPEWGYGSSLKLSTAKGMSLAERNKRIATGLREGIMPTERGSEKVSSLIADIESQIAKPIAEAQKAGSTIPRELVAKRLDDVFEKFQNQVNPLPDIGDIAKVEEGFVTTVPSRIPIEQAQKMKKGTYAQLKGKYGKVGSASIESEKALARGLKDEVYSELERQYPQLKNLAALGEREGSLVALKDSLDSAIKRIQNTEGIPLRSSIGMATGNAPFTLATLLELPRIKSALSIALYRAGKKAKTLAPAAEGLGKLPPYAYGIGKYTASEE